MWPTTSDLMDAHQSRNVTYKGWLHFASLISSLFFTILLATCVTVRRAIPYPGGNTDKIAHIEADRKTNNITDKQNVTFNEQYNCHKLALFECKNCHKNKISYL